MWENLYLIFDNQVLSHSNDNSFIHSTRNSLIYSPPLSAPKIFLEIQDRVVNGYPFAIWNFSFKLD